MCESKKTFQISRLHVVEAYRRARANAGAAGVDNQTLKDFERDLKENLYKIWNRLSSGSWMPPSVRAVEIPRKDGSKRLLGIPTVSDRIAQMTVLVTFEPGVSPYGERAFVILPCYNRINFTNIISQRLHLLL
nr:hypothetical protein [Escherichia sp. E4385]